MKAIKLQFYIETPWGKESIGGDCDEDQFLSPLAMQEWANGAIAMLQYLYLRKRKKTEDTKPI